MPENKTKPTEVSVAEFVAAIPDDAQRADAQTLIELMRAATGEEPKMWGPSIIGFGSLRYQYDSGRSGEIAMVSFSPRKSANVLYGVTGFSGAEKWLGKLGKHTMGKGCLYIKKLSDVDRKTLETMVGEAVKAKRKRSPE